MIPSYCEQDHTLAQPQLTFLQSTKKAMQEQSQINSLQTVELCRLWTRRSRKWKALTLCQGGFREVKHRRINTFHLFQLQPHTELRSPDIRTIFSEPAQIKPIFNLKYFIKNTETNIDFICLQIFNTSVASTQQTQTSKHRQNSVATRILSQTETNHQLKNRMRQPSPLYSIPACKVPTSWF